MSPGKVMMPERIVLSGSSNVSREGNVALEDSFIRTVEKEEKWTGKKLS